MLRSSSREDRSTGSEARSCYLACIESRPRLFMRRRRENEGVILTPLRAKPKPGGRTCMEQRSACLSVYTTNALFAGLVQRNVSGFLAPGRADFFKIIAQNISGCALRISRAGSERVSG